MLRNNLTETNNQIPNIKISLYANWKNSICIDFSDNFTILDLFLTIKSYSDSLILISNQIINSILKMSTNSTIFAQSLYLHTLQNMNILDFAIWLNERLNKDCVYMDEEIYIKRFIIVFFSFNFSMMYPKYPWNEESLKLIKQMSDDEKEKIIKNLLKEIEKMKK